MKKEDIHLGDWKRILLGETPLEFMIEIFVRTFIIYMVLLLIIRLFGRRLNAQLSLIEMAIVLALGAIIAVPLQLPERGLLPAILILFLTVLFDKGINKLGFKYAKVDDITKGNTTLVVKDGILQFNEMKGEALSKERLFSVLRLNKIHQLGQIKRAYMEPTGAFSLFKNEEPLPGLSILPDAEHELHHTLNVTTGLCACVGCGFVKVDEKKTATACPVCGCTQWTKAFK